MMRACVWRASAHACVRVCVPRRRNGQSLTPIRAWLSSGTTAQHEGRAPTTFDEKQEFKAQVTRAHHDAIPDPDERHNATNYLEAIGNAHIAYLPYEVPEEAEAVLRHDKVRALGGGRRVAWRGRV